MITLFHHIPKKLYLCEKVSNKILIMIKDFNFYAPTRVVFGRESEKKIGELVAANGGKKVLIHYGGGSAQRSGLLDVY